MSEKMEEKTEKVSLWERAYWRRIIFGLLIFYGAFSMTTDVVLLTFDPRVRFLAIRGWRPQAAAALLQGSDNASRRAVIFKRSAGRGMLVLGGVDPEDARRLVP